MYEVKFQNMEYLIITKTLPNSKNLIINCNPEKKKFGEWLL